MAAPMPGGERPVNRANLVVAEPVCIAAAHGPLAGTLFHNRSGAVPAPGIILTHCLGGGRQGYAWLARWLCTLGFTVITYDLPGHGESPGLAGLRLLDDLRSVIAFARKQPAVAGDTLILGGLCVGGSLSIRLATEYPGVVRAVFGSSVVPETFHLREYVWEYMVNSITNPELCPNLHRFDPEAYRPLLAERDVREFVNELAVPLLLVQYQKDRMMPLRIAREVYERAPGPKRMAILSGGTHTAFWTDPRVAWVLFDWLQYLRCTGRLPAAAPVRVVSHGGGAHAGLQ